MTIADPSIDQDLVDALVRNASVALRKRMFMSAFQPLWSLCESALGGGADTVASLDHALAALAELPTFATSQTGAELRLFFRSMKFRALRGQAGALELVLPGDDLRCVTSIDDVLGPWPRAFGGPSPIHHLSASERDRLLTAWTAVDWDNTLGLESFFECDITRTRIEDRPWAELAPVVERTSLRRLAAGEAADRTLTRLFACAAPLEARVALAESLVTFATAQRAKGQAVLAIVIGAILPALEAAGRAPTKLLDKAARKLAPSAARLAAHERP